MEMILRGYELISEWRRSSRCDSSQCAEVARTASGVALRNSTTEQVILPLSVGAWRGFIDGLKHGDFDGRPASS